MKSHREIESLRASADLVSRTLGEIAREIGPGVTTKDLDTLAETFIRDSGAVPAFKGYGPSSNPFPATLCTSLNDTVVHGIPDDRPLRDGDVISIDCGVRLNGYYGDSAYTFCIGDVSDENRLLCSTTYDALQVAVGKAVVGNRVGDIGWAVQNHCEPNGFGVVRALVGHGIGKNLHEDPQIPNFGRKGTGRKLKDGLAICIEPMINRGTADVFTDRDGWTIKTKDGKASAHYEFMVVIRPEHAEVLTNYRYVEDALDVIPYKLTADTQNG